MARSCRACMTGGTIWRRWMFSRRSRTLRLRFLELVAGRPQSLPLLRITTGDSLPPDVLEVHWSHHPRRSEEHESSFGGPHPADLPLDPIRRSAEFANVLSRWLAADSERLAARSRFHSSFALQSYYTVDRLIGAANSFDLLPESAVPDKVALSNEIKTRRIGLAICLRRYPTVSSAVPCWVPLGGLELHH